MGKVSRTAAWTTRGRCVGLLAIVFALFAVCLARPDLLLAQPPAPLPPGPLPPAPLPDPIPPGPLAPPEPPVVGPAEAVSVAPGLDAPLRLVEREERNRTWPYLYGSAELLLWQLSDYSVPPLVTTGPAQFPVGFLGNPGTQVLFAGSALDTHTFPGARFTAGVWFDPCFRFGVEGDYFFLAEQSRGATFDSAAYPVLTRPFTRADTGAQLSEFAAFPDISTGAIAIDATTELWGAGARARVPLWGACRGGVALLGGFQFLSLRDTLSITEAAAFLPNGPFPELNGRSFLVVDRFETRNEFYGGQLGFDARLRRGNWLLDLRALIGIGSTHQEVDIRGGQLVANPNGSAAVYPGGLLALPGANIGRVTHDAFSVVPQVGLNLGYQLSRRVTLFVGYSFLYWTNVVRPGDQIDPVLDPTRIPNFITTATPTAPPRPANPFHRSDLWAHGVNLGLGVNW